MLSKNKSAKKNEMIFNSQADFNFQNSQRNDNFSIDPIFSFFLGLLENIHVVCNLIIIMKNYLQIRFHSLQKLLHYNQTKSHCENAVELCSPFSGASDPAMTSAIF